MSSQPSTNSPSSLDVLVEDTEGISLDFGLDTDLGELNRKNIPPTVRKMSRYSRSTTKCAVEYTTVEGTALELQILVLLFTFPVDVLDDELVLADTGPRL